jgi:catechol 2,3-dioxygenase-like lactoylglutathione lyase family enzyme
MASDPKEVLMYDHIGLEVADIGRSVRFYEAALAPLGFVLGSRDENGAGFGPPGEPRLWLARGAPAPTVHVAFAAPDRAAVDGFHAAGLDVGGRCNGAPGLRADYGPRYYAAFLVDPDGNNVEAVFNR